jgi:hypothetical protein
MHDAFSSYLFLNWFNELHSEIHNIGPMLIPAGSKLLIKGMLRGSFLTPDKGETRIGHDGGCGLWGCYVTQAWSQSLWWKLATAALNSNWEVEAVRSLITVVGNANDNDDDGVVGKVIMLILIVVVVLCLNDCSYVGSQEAIYRTRIWDQMLDIYSLCIVAEDGWFRSRSSTEQKLVAINCTGRKSWRCWYGIKFSVTELDICHAVCVFCIKLEHKLFCDIR